MNSSEFFEKNNCLKEVIRELADDSKLTDEKLTEYLTRFDNIYSNDFRHDYSEVTRILFSLTSSQDVRDFMASKVKDIYNKSKEVNEKSYTTKALKKLKDHINLENIRMVELIKISTDVTAANETAATLVGEFDKNQHIIKDLNREIEKAEENVKSVQESIKNSTTESITILSIFAGIVITFSGGISFIANAISGINKIEPYRLSVFILLIGNIMFNVIFLLLYMIGKITNKYTGSRSVRCFEEICNNKKFSCYVIKYPYIIWFNFIDIYCIAISLYLSFIDRFNVFTRMLNRQWWWSFLSVILGVFLIILFLCFTNKIKNINCSKQNN